MACGVELRLQDFPRGLGKGSDAAIVGAWMESVLDNLQLDLVPVAGQYLYQLIS